MITGISHITFIVEDLERSSRFFDAGLVYSSRDKRFSISQEKFFMIGDVCICIMQGDSLADRTYNHVAFKAPDDEFDAYLDRINAFGVDIRPERCRVGGEGRSIYFYDFDNHLFELHSGTLDERLRRYSL